MLRAASRLGTHSSYRTLATAAGYAPRTRAPPPHTTLIAPGPRTHSNAYATISKPTDDAMTTQVDKSRYLADSNPPVCSLRIADSFKALTREEKLYAHYISQASWAGGRIIQRQTTPTAERLCDLVIATFSAAKGKAADLEALKAKSGVSDEDWNELLAYSAQVLSNLSNMRSFGATKFIPRVSEQSFEAVVKASQRSDVALPLWQELKEEIYSLSPEASLSIGKPSAGHVSAYYPSSPAPSDAQVDEVQALCDAAGISTANTRLSRVSDTELVLLVASISALPSHYPKSLKSEKLGFEVRLQAGDYADALAKVDAALAQAGQYAANDNQREMLKHYAKSFETGNIEAHKEGSRSWVKDVGPVVESYIGFIEDYVDPFGARAEWEGFTAIVNKAESAKFDTLVQGAAEHLKTLPWPKEYEVDVFKRPDFTALEILSFATSGIPAGINIPNYYDIRESLGFKNVSLINVLSAKAPGEPCTFIYPDEVEQYRAWEDKAFSVQVANHELLGHGSGKLFQQRADGSRNFDPEKTINPLTGEPIESWYMPGETYGSKVGPVSSSMEECRAEAVALYLASNADIATIFGHDTKEAQEDLVYYTFLVMMRAGVRALEFYDPTTKKHGQAHMQARLGIAQWLISHDIARVEFVHDDSGNLVDAFARVDRKAALERGKEVMGQLLVEIQVRKSTGDGPGATKFYTELTAPSAEWVDKLRPLVLAKKLPRKVFVQPNTVVNPSTGDVELVEYPTTPEGVVQSFIERDL
ncbi:RHTO0S13e05182g1_1 [Rhodotorula toruloides]|uniref:Dipeptidyl peptidase 3 n=1 Tax=Rhodotorula toruloides TaxID=5286 RepID=A0A061BGQ6_RHOTO|nr:RHTO0S13e05182g1_1 [Rhodotorula toruloides]